MTTRCVARPASTGRRRPLARSRCSRTPRADALSASLLFRTLAAPPLEADVAAARSLHEEQSAEEDQQHEAQRDDRVANRFADSTHGSTSCGAGSIEYGATKRVKAPPRRRFREDSRDRCREARRASSYRR